VVNLTTSGDDKFFQSSFCSNGVKVHEDTQYEFVSRRRRSGRHGSTEICVKESMHLYAYPVIFFIFACKDAYGIVVKRRRYAEAFIYKACEARQCCKRGYRFDISEVAKLHVPTVGPDMS
jgi:hypothetical protein